MDTSTGKKALPPQACAPASACSSTYLLTGQMDPRLWAVMGTWTASFISQAQPAPCCPYSPRPVPNSPMGLPTPLDGLLQPCSPAAPDTWPFTNLAGSLLLGKACALQGASLWPALGWDGWMDRWTDNPAVAGVPAPSVPVLPGWWIYVPCVCMLCCRATSHVLVLGCHCSSSKP